MTISMYSASIPVWQHMLKGLSAVLAKAAAHADARKIDPSVLLQSRLFPDMLPLVKQVQIVTDQAKGGASRLAGVDIPKYEDTETTFDQLQARIAKTVAYLETITPAQVDGSETKHITMQFGPTKHEFTGQDYLLKFVNPNFFFHISVAYSLLRHNGVELGKKDFLG